MIRRSNIKAFECIIIALIISVDMRSIQGRNEPTSNNRKKTFLIRSSVISQNDIYDLLGRGGDGMVKKPKSRLFETMSTYSDIGPNHIITRSVVNTSDSDSVSNNNRYDIKQTALIMESKKSDIEYRNALIKTSLTVLSAALFGFFVIATRGLSSGYEFFAGYLMEQSLSIDNLFVFIMLFEYFKVPMDLQNRVLQWGVFGAVLLRGVMIGFGVAALQKFKSLILLFAGILIFSSISMLSSKKEQIDTESDNRVVKLTKALFPNTTSELHGERFFVTLQGQRMATPLFLCLLCVEFSDFIFAVDSIPAVLGVSKDPVIIYASNIFAILGLRSLYTVVAKAITAFQYLKPAVAMILLFVGMKMIAEYFHVNIGVGTSLAVICSLVTTSIVASMVANKGKRREREN